MTDFIYNSSLIPDNNKTDNTILLKASNSWTGRNTYNSTLPLSILEPVNDYEFTNKAYVDAQFSDINVCNSDNVWLQDNHFIYLPTSEDIPWVNYQLANKIYVDQTVNSIKPQNKDNEWTGMNTFNSKLPVSNLIPIYDNDFSNKHYVDSSINSLLMDGVNNWGGLNYGLTPSQADNSGQWATTEFTNLKLSSLVYSKNTWTNENKFNTLLLTNGLLNYCYELRNSSSDLSQTLSGAYVYAYSFEEIITINLPDKPLTGTTFTIYNAGTFKINISAAINSGFEGMYLVRNGDESIFLQNGAYITLYFRGAWIVISGSCTVLASTLIDNKFTGTQTFTNLNAKETILINGVNIDNIYSPLNDTVDLRTNQNIDGIKNFSTCPILPDESILDTYLSSNVALLNKDNQWLGTNTVNTPATTSNNEQIATTFFVNAKIEQIQTINSTYSCRYTSSTTIIIPPNCFKIDISCISCGGRAAAKKGDTYGGAGGGGGVVTLSDLFIASAFNPTNFYIIIDSIGKIDTKLGGSPPFISIAPGGNANGLNGGIGSTPVFVNYFGGNYIFGIGTNGDNGGTGFVAPFAGRPTSCYSGLLTGVGEGEPGSVYDKTSIVIVTYYLYN